MICQTEEKIDTSSTNESKYCFMTNLPETIIENDIFSYLNTTDLFYSVRGVSSEWSELMKNVWNVKLKDEMIDQVKSIDFIYEKEVFTKTYEFKLKYLINYKNLLTAYNDSANILAIIKSILEKIDDAQVFGLILQIFSFVGITQGVELMSNYSPIVEPENSNQSLISIEDYLNNEHTYHLYRNKMMDLLDIEENYSDTKTLNTARDNFAVLVKEHLENVSENAKLIYSFLQGLIEFQILKIEVKELRHKIEDLINRIQAQTNLWPRKKKFFEKAYKLILFTKSANSNTKTIINLFEKNKIRHPLYDFNDEALKLIYDLRDRLNECKELSSIDGVDDVIFDNILKRRILLTQKFLILEKFHELYKQFKQKNIEDDEELFAIKDENFSVKQFLWCMKFSSNQYQENLTSDTMLTTKRYLDRHFDYDNHIIYECEKEKNEELEAKNRDVLKLREEKEKLELQKEKTENILNMMKKFVQLKETMNMNKKKYKTILYLLNKVRNGELESINQDSVEGVIQEIDLENMDLKDYPLTETEQTELENFDNTDEVLKEIEGSMLKQIEEIFRQNNSNNDDN